MQPAQVQRKTIGFASTDSFADVNHLIKLLHNICNCKCIFFAYTLPTKSAYLLVFYTLDHMLESFYVAHCQTVSHLLLNGINKSPALPCAFSQASFDNNTMLLSQVVSHVTVICSYIFYLVNTSIPRSTRADVAMWRQDSIVQHPLSPMSKQKPGLTS